MSTWDVGYGPDGSSEPAGSRFLRLHRVPAGTCHGTVVVLHGGYWKNKFGLDDVAGPGALAIWFNASKMIEIESTCEPLAHVYFLDAVFSFKTWVDVAIF